MEKSSSQALNWSVYQGLTTLDNLTRPDAIANFLNQQGVKGVMGHGQQCAISQWIRKVLTKDSIPFEMVSTTSQRITVRGLRSTLTIEVSIPVQNFIQRFDAQKYPFLAARDQSGRPINGGGIHCTCPLCKFYEVTGEVSKYAAPIQDIPEATFQGLAKLMASYAGGGSPEVPSNDAIVAVPSNDPISDISDVVSVVIPHGELVLAGV